MVDENTNRFEKRGHTISWIKSTKPHVSQMDSDRPTSKAETQPEPTGRMEALDDSSATRDPHILVGSRPSIPDADASVLPQKSVVYAEDATRIEAPDSTLTDTNYVSVEPEAVDTVFSLSDSVSEEQKVDEEAHPVPQSPVLYKSTELPAGEPVPSAPVAEELDAIDKDAGPLEQGSEEAEISQILEEGTTVRRATLETATQKLATVFADTAEDGDETKEDDTGWGDWGFATSLSKKKKKQEKQGVECSFDVFVPESVPECATELPLPEVASEPVLAVKPSFAEGKGNSWVKERIIPKKTKKKPKKPKRKETHEEAPPRPPPGSEAAPDLDLMEPSIVVEDVQDARSTVQTTMIPESDICSRRLGHLFEGDGWRTCELCLAHMREIASKLHAVDLSNVDGVSPAVY